MNHIMVIRDKCVYTPPTTPAAPPAVPSLPSGKVRGISQLAVQIMKRWMRCVVVIGEKGTKRGINTGELFHECVCCKTETRRRRETSTDGAVFMLAVGK